MNDNLKKRKYQEIDRANAHVFNEKKAVDDHDIDYSEPFPVKEIRWRFIANPLDCMRLTISGRDVCIMRRSPTNNWGFVIENCWSLFSSFNMPLQGDSQSLDLLIGNSCQWKEALFFNTGFNVMPQQNMHI